jgi:hypothetical protein
MHIYLHEFYKNLYLNLEQSTHIQPESIILVDLIVVECNQNNFNKQLNNLLLKDLY